MDLIRQHSGLYPALKDKYVNLGELFTQKLYHELTLALTEFVTDKNCHSNDNLIQLYKEFIAPIQDKLNPLKLILICCEISTQFTDPKHAIAYLQGLLDRDVTKKKLGEEATLVCLFKICYYQIIQNGPDEMAKVKEILEERKDQVEGLVGAEPLVHAYYYFAALKYYQQVGPASLYYKNALMFLAYSPYEDLNPAERVDLATNISLAALSGEGVFNFGEVLATPILQALKDTDKEWLSELLHTFNRGDIDKFNEIVAANHAAFNSQPALVNQKDYIKEKVALLALVELIFHRPAHERNIPFALIAEKTRLPLNQVEWLVMRAMSVKLIKGSIDQVNQMVSITYVQPRVLDQSQIVELKDRLKDWNKKVHDTLLFVEDETPELFE